MIFRLNPKFEQKTQQRFFCNRLFSLYDWVLDLLVVVSCHVLLHVALDEAVEPVALAHVAHELHRRRLHHRCCPEQKLIFNQTNMPQSFL